MEICAVAALARVRVVPTGLSGVTFHKRETFSPDNFS